jgi:hypothetical protein
MGSAASKTSVSRRTAGWLQSKMEQMHAQIDADTVRELAQKQRDAGEGGFTDPSAVDYGFTRGYGRQHKADIMQTHYLQQRAKALGREDSEMPPELLQFLKDMPPLERTVDVELTSKRLQKDDAVVGSIERGDRQRTIREMPLMGEEMDFTARRTTNFGTSVREVDAEDFGCRDWQLYTMLKEKDTTDVAAFWNDIHKAQNVSDEIRLQQTELLRSAINFIELPIIMKDKSDNTFLGIWPHDLEELQADEEIGHLYVSVGEDRIQFCVRDFQAIDQAEDAKAMLNPQMLT